MYTCDASSGSCVLTPIVVCAVDFDVCTCVYMCVRSYDNSCVKTIRVSILKPEYSSCIVDLV